MRQAPCQKHQEHRSSSQGSQCSPAAPSEGNPLQTSTADPPRENQACYQQSDEDLWFVLMLEVLYTILRTKHRGSGLLHNDVIFSPVENNIFKIYIILWILLIQVKALYIRIYLMLSKETSCTLVHLVFKSRAVWDETSKWVTIYIYSECKEQYVSGWG